MAVVNCAPSGTLDCPGSGGNVAVLLGNGDGTFENAQTFTRGGYGVFSSPIVAADVNGDKKLDLLVGNYCPLVGGDCVGDGSVGVLIGNGDGTFQAAVAYDSGDSYANSIVLADVNADGVADLVVASGGAGVLLGNGDGTFQPAQIYPTGGSAGSVLVTDVNGDGKPDLVATDNSSSYVSVLLGNGDGTFQEGVGFPLGGVGYSSAVMATDLNGDGYPDLVAANFCETLKMCRAGKAEKATVGVLLNNSAPQEPMGAARAVGKAAANRDARH